MNREDKHLDAIEPARWLVEFDGREGLRHLIEAVLAAQCSSNVHKQGKREHGSLFGFIWEFMTRIFSDFSMGISIIKQHVLSKMPTPPQRQQS